MFWRKRNFLDSVLYFFVKIPLTNEHLFYNHFLRLPVGNCFATSVRPRPCFVESYRKSLSIPDTDEIKFNLCCLLKHVKTKYLYNCDAWLKNSI